MKIQHVSESESIIGWRTERCVFLEVHSNVEKKMVVLAFAVERTLPYISGYPDLNSVKAQNPSGKPVYTGETFKFTFGV